MVVPYVWILDASDAPWMLQTLQNLALARLWSLGSARIRRSKTSHLLGSGLCETVGGVAQAVGSGLWRAKSFFSSGPKLPFKRLIPGFWTLQTLHGCLRRSKTSHLLDCGLWALRESDAPKPRACQTVGSGLCETVGGVAQAVGSGRWRAGAASLWILDASDAPKPRTCQTVGSGLCETVGGVAQAVGSGLWRAKSFFSSGPKLPFKRLKPLKPLKRSDTCQWLCHTSGFWTLQTLHGCLRRSKTSHLLDCGLWALRESDAPKPRTCQTVGSGLFKTVGGVAQAVGSGRWRAGAASLWILDASDAPKPRTCQTVGSGLCETVGGVAQAVGSGLWRAKSFFSSGPKLPFKRLKPLTPLKPLKRFDTGHGCAIRLDAGRFRRSMDASDAPKPRTC